MHLMKSSSPTSRRAQHVDHLILHEILYGFPVPLLVRLLVHPRKIFVRTPARYASSRSSGSVSSVTGSSLNRHASMRFYLAHRLSQRRRLVPGGEERVEERLVFMSPSKSYPRTTSASAGISTDFTSTASAATAGASAGVDAIARVFV